MRTFRKAELTTPVTTLEGEYYTSDAVFAREKTRIFSHSWCCVTRDEKLPHPGDFVVVEVAGESLIVMRDRGGRVRAFYNVCRHRGTRLCEAVAGHATSIQCPYHAWTYGLDGALLAARNMQKVPGFTRDEYPLHQATVATFDGFVFVNLDSASEPFISSYAPILARFSAWNIGRLRSVREIEYDLACNWKLVFQNYSECYHCPLIHPQLDRLSPSDSGRNDLTEGPVLGGFSELRHPGSSLTTTGVTMRAPVGTVSGDDLVRVYYYTIFPTLLLSLHPDYVMVHYITPLGPARTRIVCAWLFDPVSIAADAFDPSDAIDFWDLTNRQDWHVSELTQSGVASRAYTPGPYAQAEGLLAAFDRHYHMQLDTV